MTEYLERVSSDVLIDERLAKFGKELPRLLVEQVTPLPQAVFLSNGLSTKRLSLALILRWPQGDSLGKRLALVVSAADSVLAFCPAASGSVLGVSKFFRETLDVAEIYRQRALLRPKTVLKKNLIVDETRPVFVRAVLERS